MAHNSSYETTFYDNSHKALEALPFIQPDLIILNMMMADSLVMLKILQQLPLLSSVPIILLVGSTQSIDWSIEIAAIITMPITPLALFEKVEKIWDNYHKADNFLPKDKMEELRFSYLEELQKYKLKSVNFYARFKEGTASENDYDTLHNYAHNLCGTGTIYGYPYITKTASVLEEMLRDTAKPQGEIFLKRIDDMCTACDKAIATFIPVKVLAPAATELLTTFVHPFTILVVDDDQATCNLLVALLRNQAEIVSTTNANDALEIIRHRLPDLILLDDLMPEMTGTELLTILKKDAILSTIPTIMLTASNRVQDIIKATKEGAVDYITKPFDPAILEAKVIALLGRLKTTVLIADDDIMVRALLAAKFHTYGLQILEAEDGNQALQLIQERQPQLVILDRMMPGLDGRVVLQKLQEQENTRNIPIVFLTAKHHEKDIVECLRLGAADYIIKPFISEEVVLRSLRLLGIKATQS